MRITFNLSFSGNVFLFRPVCQWKLVLWWTLGGEGELLLVFFSPPVYWATRAPFEQETSLPLIPQSGYCRPFDSSDYLTLGPYYTYRRDHTEAKNIPPEKKKWNVNIPGLFVWADSIIFVLRQEKNLSSLVTFITFLQRILKNSKPNSVRTEMTKV